jgi:hypothetical protein
LLHRCPVDGALLPQALDEVRALNKGLVGGERALFSALYRDGRRSGRDVSWHNVRDDQARMHVCTGLPVGHIEQLLTSLLKRQFLAGACPGNPQDGDGVPAVRGFGGIEVVPLNALIGTSMARVNPLASKMGVVVHMETARRLLIMMERTTAGVTTQLDRPLETAAGLFEGVLEAAPVGLDAANVVVRDGFAECTESHF